MYGLDKELADKAAKKYDVGKEKEARAWLEDILGEPKTPSVSFLDYLKDGAVLLKAAKKIIPGVATKVNDSKMPFKQMENINNFLLALDKLGLPKHEMFQTIDLYEAKNMGSVIDTIFAFSRHAHAKGYTQILLGPKLSGK